MTGLAEDMLTGCPEGICDGSGVIAGSAFEDDDRPCACMIDENSDDSLV